MDKLRNTYAFRIFWLLLAVQFLNLSVDSVDLFQSSRFEDLSINDQESILEIVLEKILGIENAVVEYDESDSETESGKKSRTDLDPATKLAANKALTNKDFDSLEKEKLRRESERLTAGFNRIDTPPPKA